MRFIILILLLGLVLPSQSQAFVFDINTFYFSDSLKTSDSSTTSRTFYNLFLGFSLDKKDRYQVGWSYASFSTSDKAGDFNQTYSSTQMGPGFLWYLDKRRQWRLGLYYHLKVDGKYKTTGSVAEELRGSAFAADFGYQIPMTESFSLAIRLNYSSTSYNESFEEDTKTDVSYSRGIIYPSIGLNFEF